MRFDVFFLTIYKNISKIRKNNFLAKKYSSKTHPSPPKPMPSSRTLIVSFWEFESDTVVNLLITSEMIVAANEIHVSINPKITIFISVYFGIFGNFMGELN